jgi:hypothetical protein
MAGVRVFFSDEKKKEKSGMKKICDDHQQHMIL